MALVRCKQCGLNNLRTKRIYLDKVEPSGHPETALICGLRECENPGLVWLEEHELKDYQKGVEFFVFLALLQR